MTARAPGAPGLERSRAAPNRSLWVGAPKPGTGRLGSVWRVARGSWGWQREVMEAVGSRSPRSGARHPRRPPPASLHGSSSRLARRPGGPGTYWGRGWPEFFAAGLWGESLSLGEIPFRGEEPAWAEGGMPSVCGSPSPCLTPNLGNERGGFGSPHPPRPTAGWVGELTYPKQTLGLD